MTNSFFQRHGIKTFVNAAGPMTRLSGHILAPEVREAMSQAASACARVEDLQHAAGELIVEATGAEAGYVTAGAAAGLAMGAAAAIAKLDPAAMDQLPDTTGLRNEIIIQREHLTAYSHALRFSGAQLVEVGYVGYPGQGRTWPWQIEAAINEKSAAIAYSVGESPGAVGLSELCEVAHRHDLPVIVDAAAALPPVENLRRFVDEGADIVCFSGGKAIGGPQASGILAGRSELVASVALQHQDMDVELETWTWRERYLDSAVLPGPPHHGIGRPMKVGKEEIAGLMAALELYLARDHDAQWQEWLAMLQAITEQLSDVPGVETTIYLNSQTPKAPPIARIRLDEQRLEMKVAEVTNALLDGEPAVAVSQNFYSEGDLGISPVVLQAGEERVVAQRIRDVILGSS